MANLLDRVIFKPASSGTGDFVVSTAVAGYQTPAAAGAVNATVYYYAAESADKSQWEVGSGAYTVGTTTLARTNVYFNSLGTTAKISFTVAPNVMVTLLNETPLGGAPGGSSGQIEYNAAGSFGGIAGSVVDNTNQTLTLASIANPAASTLTLTGGTALTTSQPVLNMTQTWNAGGTVFTGLKFNATNTASASGSLLADFQLGGVTIFSVDATGSANGARAHIGASSQTGNTDFMLHSNGHLYDIALNPSGILGFYDGSTRFALSTGNGGNVRVANDWAFAWSSSSSDATVAADTFLTRGGAGIVQQGGADGASPAAQTFRAQSVVAGTSNTAGTDWTFIGSKGTGTGAGGNILLQTAPAGSTGTAQNAGVQIAKFNGNANQVVLTLKGNTGNPAIDVDNGGVTGIGKSGGAGNLTFWQGAAVRAGVGAGFILPSGNSLGWSSANDVTSALDTALIRPAAATLQHGAADAAAPVAQTIQVQSVVAGTSNTAGTDWTLQGSRGTGTGIGGSIVFKTAPAGTTGTAQNAAVTALTIDSTQLGNFAGYIHWAGQSRVTSDFSVTSSAVLVNVTGLTANVAAGRTYYFEVYLTCTCAAAGGVKAAVAGTATATNIIYDGFVLDSNTTKGQANSTALAGTVASSTTTATAGLVIQIQGTITVAAAGTLTVQFAQNTSNGTASVVKRGSWFEVDDIQ